MSKRDALGGSLVGAVFLLFVTSGFAEEPYYRG